MQRYSLNFLTGPANSMKLPDMPIVSKGFLIFWWALAGMLQSSLVAQDLRLQNPGVIHRGHF